MLEKMDCYKKSRKFTLIKVEVLGIRRHSWHWKHWSCHKSHLGSWAHILLPLSHRGSHRAHFLCARGNREMERALCLVLELCVTDRVSGKHFLCTRGNREMERDGERFVSIALCLVLELCITDQWSGLWKTELLRYLSRHFEIGNYRSFIRFFLGLGRISIIC